jgi:hypothetical protein
MANKTNQAITEPSVDESGIGTYGWAWINWMQTHHKKKVREMKANHIFHAVARSVDMIKTSFTKNMINTTFPCKAIIFTYSQQQQNTYKTGATFTESHLFLL